jgi:hypothetical protein
MYNPLMKHMRRTQILVTQQQYQALQRIAGETGLAVSEHIRRAVDEYLEGRPPHGRDERHKKPGNTEMAEDG